MKNNTKTYLLIAAVLAVWGTIGYKIVSGLDSDNPEVVMQNDAVAFNPKRKTVVDTFSIQAASRDPFLGTLTTKKKLKSTAGIPKKKEEMPNKPLITYGGLVKKQQSTEQVFVVNINNQQYLLKKGQTVADITLVKGSVKEIVVRYQNTTEVITIQ